MGQGKSQKKESTGLFVPAFPLYLFAVLLLVFACGACARSDSNAKGDASSMGGDQKGGDVVYAALGDSTGVGVGARKGGYVSRLFERIKRERPASRLTNACVSGAETEDVLRSQIKLALAARPSLITLGIGINDVGHGVTPERFSANYEEIITRLKAETDAPIVITNIPDISLAPAIPALMRDEVYRRVNLFNERIKEIAQRHGLIVVDAYTVTREVISSRPGFFSDDGFHPSDEGYEQWAEMMWPTVKSAIDG
jgi:lysophospholipase L1-like esterase